MFNRCRVSGWEDKVLEVDSGDGCTTMGTYLMPLSCTLKNGQNGKFSVMYVLGPLKKIN